MGAGMVLDRAMGQLPTFCKETTAYKPLHPSRQLLAGTVACCTLSAEPCCCGSDSWGPVLQVCLLLACCPRDGLAVLLGRVCSSTAHPSEQGQLWLLQSAAARRYTRMRLLTGVETEATHIRRVYAQLQRLMLQQLAIFAH
jgi:hypothetical protein